jgi:hypothetical protein
MTEEEADALDELWTKTTPEIDMSKPGYYRTRMAHLVAVDAFTAVWLKARVDATGQTAAAVLGELVRKEIALTG